MKYVLLASIIFATMVFFVPTQVRAVVFGALGGKIISTTTPGVICGGYGPMTTAPVNMGAPGPYYLSPTRLKTPPTNGANFLGTYARTVTYGLCFTESYPPVPYPVFLFTVFGSSKK